MRRTFRPGLLLLVLWTSFGTPAHAQEPQRGWLTDFDAALAEAQRLQRPLLVHFYTDWCPPCKRMEQSVLNRLEILDEIRRSAVAVKLNAERSSKIAARYGVDSFPTDLFLEPDGTEMLRSSGFRPLAEYRTAISRASTRHAELLAARARAATPPPTQLATQEREPMLNGYCPVTLWNNRRWEKGTPQFKSEHRGQVYLMSSAAALQEFNEHPERFAPRFLGCDPVVVYESDRAVPGSTQFAAFYDDELFLFVNDINRQAFKRNPDNFVRTQVVLNVDQIETVTK